MKDHWDKLGKLTSRESRELDYLYLEYEKTICLCCPEYKLPKWEQDRLEELEYRFRKFGEKKR